MLLLKKRFFGILVLFMLVIGFGACGGEDRDDDGTGRKFWALNTSTDKYYSLRADLLYEGNYCNVYVEQGLDLSKYSLTASSLEEMAEDVADAYDNKIYQKMINTFSIDGPIYNPQDSSDYMGNNIMEFADAMADGDGKLTILILDIKGGNDRFYVAGYFSPLNMFARDNGKVNLGANGKYTNECDMIYLNIRTDPGSTESNMTLAHEMQHMMCFATDVYVRNYNWMDLWINEGLSSAAEYVYSGQHNEERILHFAYATLSEYSQYTKIPAGNNFFVWGERPDYILDEYATVYLFFQWLRLQSIPLYGSLSNYNIYKAIIGSTSYDQEAVVNALKGKGNYSSGSDSTTLTWGAVLLDWFAANYLAFPITVATPYGTLGKPKHGYMADSEDLMLAFPKMLTSSSKQIYLYAGEGVYSKTASSGSISYPDSGLNIKYAGVDINSSSTPISGTGEVDAKTYANGVLITYNVNPNNKKASSGLYSTEKGYVANIVSTDTNFSLMKQSAFSIQSVKATTSSSQAITSLDRTTKPPKPQAISMGDMLRMNGHKDTGNDAKNFSRVK